MNPRLIFLLTAALCAGRLSAADAPAVPVVAPAAAKPAVAAALGAAPSRKDSSIAPTASFDTFRLINDRNIFNPNRTGRRERGSEERAPRLDVITLVGTMESDKGLRAFFDGSERNYRRALSAGGAVDKFKVTQVSPNVVELERDGKTFSMRVGQQFRRPDGGDWTLIGEDVVAREAQAQAAAEAGAKIDPMAPVAIPAGASDILRRMMEARNKSLKQ
ncbi:MAG: hypothetical protein NTV51_21985 [Verrucomicrobia bacterium]|nr:hypothetical protein [Verrucomicrobiota bacterium]